MSDPARDPGPAAAPAHTLADFDFELPPAARTSATPAATSHSDLGQTVQVASAAPTATSASL